MPKRRVSPFRPTVREISAMLKANRDTYWVDARGRTYGFMRGAYSLALWRGGAMEDDESHAWVLLPPIERGGARKDWPAFPAVGSRVTLMPRQRPDAGAKASIEVRRYVHRPRRQRAAGFVAAATSFSGVEFPTGRELAREDERRRERPTEAEEEARAEAGGR